MFSHRRSFLCRSAAALLLSLSRPARSFSKGKEKTYFPSSDKDGGWRTLDNAAQIRKQAGIDLGRLDGALQYVQTTSQHGGLLVARHGYVIYEKYFGRAHRLANPNMYSIGKMF